MRLSGVVAATIAMLIVVGLLGTELAATSLATRAVRSAVERCVEVEDIEVTSLGRPAVLGIARGEVRDVRLTATGLVAGELRVERIDARIPAAPVGIGSGPETITIVADVEMVEADLERYLVARSPALAAPTLQVTPDGIRVGDERVPFTLEAAVGITAEGDLRLVPTLGDPRLWSSLGLDLEIEVPRDITLMGLDLGEGSLVVTGRTEVHAEVDGDPGCPDVALLGAGR
jgi:hypothetical protein